MKAERREFATKEFLEATVTLPKKLTQLKEKTKQTQDRMKQLSNDASNTAVDIVTEKKTTDDRFLDMALVLSSSLRGGSGTRYDYHSDMIIETTQYIYSRLSELNTKLKANPSKPILLDRTRINSTGLRLDFGELNDSPSISYETTKEYVGVSDFHFWSSIARSMRVNLEGYRNLGRADDGYHPPILFKMVNPDYHNRWYSENITDFFTVAQLPHNDFNGLKHDLFGEPLEYRGGIFIGKEEIKNHLIETQKLFGERYRVRDIFVEKL